MPPSPCGFESSLSAAIHRSVDDTELESVCSRLEPPLPGATSGRLSVCNLRPPAPRRGSRASRTSRASSTYSGGAPPLLLGGGIHQRCAAAAAGSPASSPLQSPMDLESHTFLDVEAPEPAWWVCAGPRLGFLLPTAVLLGLSIGLFVLEEQLSIGYALLYTAVSLLGPVATWAGTGWHVQRRLRQFRLSGSTTNTGFDTIIQFIRLAAAATASPDPPPQPPQLEVTPAPEPPPRNPDDPLDFLRWDLNEWASSADGWIVIDATGIILWCNEAVKKYFGYEGDYLLQRNVRILMPQPYAAEHDSFMRKQIKTGVCKILGNPAGRPVPVVNRKGEQSMVVLSVDDHLDPHDIANYVFSGRMRFGLQDPPLIKAKAKVAQGCDVAVACQVMDAEPLTRIVTDVRGTILYANAAATKLFGWSRAELVGRNVKCLMGEPHASKHDEHLRSYIRRAQAADGTGRAVPSNIIGSGRDVVALTKDHYPLRIFLTVERIDQPSEDPAECFFHGTIVPVTSERARTNSYCSSVHRAIFSTSSKLSPSMRPTLKSLQPRPCTVVVVAVHGLSHVPTPLRVPLERLQIQQYYDEALHVIVERARAQRGMLQGIVGDCFVLVFNHSSLPNSSHRSSAAHFLVELHQRFQYSLLCRSLWLQTAAVCRHCFLAQLETQQLLLSDSVDAGFCALQVATEARVKRPVIDGTLYQELMYSWTCRLINVATLQHFKQPPSTMEVYELVERKKLANDDEWMYQLSDAEESDPWAHWTACWEELRSPASSPSAALVPLQSHLRAHPGDAAGLWLQDVLQQAAPPPVVATAGTIPYSLLCRRLAGWGPRTQSSTATSLSLPGRHDPLP